MPPSAKTQAQNFTKLPPVPVSNSAYCKCNHCGLKMSSKSLRRKILHLDKCAHYKRWQLDHPDTVEDEPIAGPSSRSDGNKRPWKNMPLSEEDRRTREAAMTIAIGGHPLTLFDNAYNPDLVRYIQGFDKSFAGVDRETIAGLIDECKEQAEVEVMKKLKGESTS